MSRLLQAQALSRLVDAVRQVLRREAGHVGKFRGIVRDNQDPEKMGRIRAEVPAVLGKAIDENQWTTWALPCVPYAGTGRGLQMVPRVGDLVWVEFEQGDIERPVWVGMFWGGDDRSAEMDADTPLGQVIETDQWRVTFRDVDGEAKLRIESKVAGGSVLEFDESTGEQKMTLSLPKDKEESVTGDATSEVTGNATSAVTGNVTETVGGDETRTVTGKYSLTVNGSELKLVCGGTTFKIASGGHVTIDGTDVRIGTLADGAGVGFCKLPLCLFTGAPHSTKTMLSA